MNGSVRNAAGLVWRHQRLVWWVFVVNMVIAWLSSLPTRAVLSSVLDHSLESAKMVTGFDLGSMVLMMERPDVSMRLMAPSAVGAVLVFVVYLLFIDGGVVAVYLEDRKLSRAEFFENAGLYFWRMVRLALLSVVPFGLLAAAQGGLQKWAGKLADDAAWDRLGFMVGVAGMLVILAAALFVRMWFDIAQVQVVRDNDRRVLRVVGRSFRQAVRWGKLYAQYLGVAAFAVVTFALGVWVWVLVPHSATGVSFVVLELVTVAQISARLWMKAASARWVGVDAVVVPMVEETVAVPPVG